jgi:hypothetical protein
MTDYSERNDRAVLTNVEIEICNRQRTNALDRTGMQLDDKILPLSPRMAVTVEIKTEPRRLI